MEILYRDDDLIAVHKPSGVYVHRPEFRVPKSQNLMALLRDQIGAWIYPVHRLDFSVSGVLLYALHPDAAAKLSEAFRENRIYKTYLAVTRGYLPDRGQVERPLRRENNGTPAPALTEFETLARKEFPYPTHRFEKTRLSLVRVFPKTGRFHQIRRHLSGLSHPIIGDTSHGDCKQNRAFRNYSGLSGLLLQATGIEFPHPRETEKGKKISIRVPENESWKRLFNSQIPLNRTLECAPERSTLLA